MKTIVLILLISIATNQEDIVKVSYYSNYHHGRKTASGEIYNMNNFTAAHKKLPFGTLVEITNISNNKTVTVRINDRGPYTKGRTFDLSKAAFNKIGNLKRGVLKVKYKIITNEKK